MIESITLAYIWDFFIFSIWTNLFAGVFIFCYTVYKALGMSKTDIEEYREFVKARDEYVELNNSGTKRFVYNLLNLLPGYTVTLACIYVWHASTTKGLHGLIRGIIAMENFSFVSLVKIRLVSKE